MRSIIAEDAQSSLPAPVLGRTRALDRLDAATSMQMKEALASTPWRAPPLSRGDGGSWSCRLRGRECPCRSNP
jgi:hypothetical protein